MQNSNERSFKFAYRVISTYKKNQDRAGRLKMGTNNYNSSPELFHDSLELRLTESMYLLWWARSKV